MGNICLGHTMYEIAKTFYPSEAMKWIFCSLATFSTIIYHNLQFQLYFESLSYYFITFTSEAFLTWSRNIEEIYDKDSVSFQKGK
jgi:hypothetical protein